MYTSINLSLIANEKGTACFKWWFPNYVNPKGVREKQIGIYYEPLLFDDNKIKSHVHVRVQFKKKEDKASNWQFITIWVYSKNILISRCEPLLVGIFSRSFIFFWGTKTEFRASVFVLYIGIDVVINTILTRNRIYNNEWKKYNYSLEILALTYV